MKPRHRDVEIKEEREVERREKQSTDFKLFKHENFIENAPQEAKKRNIRNKAMNQFM